MRTTVRIEIITLDEIERRLGSTYVMRRQYTVGRYRIDAYFEEYHIAVECDEFGHRRGYCPVKEKKRQQLIEKKLKCTFIRYDPYAKGFDVANVVNRIRTEAAEPDVGQRLKTRMLQEEDRRKREEMEVAQRRAESIAAEAKRLEDKRAAEALRDTPEWKAEWKRQWDEYLLQSQISLGWYGRWGYLCEKGYSHQWNKIGTVDREFDPCFGYDPPLPEFDELTFTAEGLCQQYLMVYRGKLSTCDDRAHEFMSDAGAERSIRSLVEKGEGRFNDYLRSVVQAVVTVYLHSPVFAAANPKGMAAWKAAEATFS